MKLALFLALSLTLGLNTVSTSAASSYFPFTLESQQVVPPAQGVEFAGSANLMLDCDEDSLRGHIIIGPGETVTGVHIHGPAEVGENGSMMFDLPLPAFLAIPNADWRRKSEKPGAFLAQGLPGGVVPVRLGGVAPYCIMFDREQCYIDVHTVAHPDGAIRGQFRHEVALDPAPWSAVKRLYR